MDIIKKLFGILGALPAFAGLFQKAAQTGKLEPTEVLSALCTLSPDTKKVTDTAMNTIQRGGNISDAMSAVMNTGKVNVLGADIDTRTLIPKLKETGGICSVMANMLEGMQNQTPQDIVEFGKQASNVKNWSDFINQNNATP